MKILRPLLAALAVVLMVGCSGTSEQLPQQAVDDEAPGAASTVGGDGSEIILAPLTAADIESAALSGELACSFSTATDGTLLLAKGDVASDAPSRGVVKVGDYVEMVAAP